MRHTKGISKIRTAVQDHHNRAYSEKPALSSSLSLMDFHKLSQGFSLKM